jgi:hypothetical protein
MAAATIQFSRNPWAIPVIYLALGIILLADLQWSMSLVFSRKLITTYTVVVLLLAIGSMISSAFYKKVIGFDPYGYFRITQVEAAVAKIDDTKERIAEEAAAKKLEVIQNKIENGQALAPAEQDFLNTEKEKVKKDSLPGKVKSLFHSTVSVKAARGVQEGTFSFKGGEPCNTHFTAYRGDKVKYINPTAPLIIVGISGSKTITSSCGVTVSGNGTIMLHGAGDGSVTVKVIPAA